MTHALAPLLSPRSIALIGASRKRNSVGNDTLRNLVGNGYAGSVFPVNPSYDSLYGRVCYPGIDALPDPVDLAILSVPNAVLERAAQEAIAAGARALLIFASAELEGDGRERIAAAARTAHVPLCGANCMGFFNAEQALPAFSALFPSTLQRGGITCIAQSGSLIQALLFNDERLKFNLAVSSGQELVTPAADFMDYALEQSSTRVITLILETIREPRKFIAALVKARDRGVPVIVLKLARTPAAASLALSHTGAIAGDAKVYDALFRQYGVIGVRDAQELAATAMLLSAPRRLAAGGMAMILDSGGERELMVDLAADEGVPFARICAQTTQALSAQLDPGLEPINPLDAWGTGRDFERIFETCLHALMSDEDSALGVFVCDLSDELDLHAAYAAVCEAVAQRSPKQLVVITNYSAWSHRRVALRLVRAGVAVLDGAAASLRAIRHALAYRDFLASTRHPAAAAPAAPGIRADRWRRLLREKRGPLTEDEGYELLSDYGISVPRHVVVADAAALRAAAQKLGYPLVLKTAAPGILHKSDADGVRLGIGDDTALDAAYADIAGRLGPRVLLCAQVPATVEMAFGLLQDRSFGAFVLVAFGGVWIEYLRDSVLAMAPVDATLVARRISELRLARVLDGVRGAPPCDRNALVQLAVQLGVLAQELDGCIAEMDLNPVLVSARGAIAVDCLIVPAFSEPNEISKP
ncbi:MAG: acetate--CoA ligase family protein [Steroidobacteraceae bacterium]